MSRVVDGLRSVSGSRQDVEVTDPSSALSSWLKSEPTPDSTSSMSSCDAASPRAKMLLSVSLLRATCCRSCSHAFDIFFREDDDTDIDGCGNNKGGGGGGGGGAGFSSLHTTSVSDIFTTIYYNTGQRTSLSNSVRARCAEWCWQHSSRKCNR